MEALGSPEAVLTATRAQLAGVVGDSKARRIQEGCKPDLLERSLAWLAQPNHFLLGLDAPDYPESLLQIGQAPPVLYGMGRRELLSAPMIAVVGSRNPTAQGERDAFAFSQALSQAGLTVVSGLALGIDTHAHRGGLSAAGASVAVVGTGLDRVYPARNHTLAQALAHDGLMLSEFPLGTAPLPGNFPRRNRIISGLSKGCLVVEAAVNSGSLVTARLAVAQGRDVFAIPGSIHSALSKGCHALIKEGAKLVESVADILEEMAWHTTLPSTALAAAGETEDDAMLLDALGHAPISLDAIVMHTGLTVSELSARLLRMEMTGTVVALPGGLYQRLI